MNDYLLKDYCYCLVVMFDSDTNVYGECPVRFIYFRNNRELTRFKEIDSCRRVYKDMDIIETYLVKVEDIDAIHFYYE